MRAFTSNGRLGGLPFHVRLVYSLFLAMALAAFALTLALVHEIVGIDLSRAPEHYAGETVLDAEVAGGPLIELPDEAIQAVPMSRRQLLETSHFHLFVMPVWFLILAHVFLLTGVRSIWKTTCIVGAAAGTGLHAIAPWIAAAAWPGATAFYGVSGALLFVTYLVMCVVPLWEMWTHSAAEPLEDS